jgi:hypothetical protein
MDKSSLETLIKWLEIWSAIFGLIVVIGVAGESYFGIRLLWNNWKLQRVEARENADLKAEIARLGAESDGTKLEIARAQERAEHDSLERIKIEQKLALRILSAAAENRLSDEFKRLGKQRVEVFALLNHDEVVWIRDQIVAAMREAGWDARHNANRRIPSTGIVNGILVELNAGASPQRCNIASGIAQALKSAGLQAAGPVVSYSLVSDAPIEVLVGNKP